MRLILPCRILDDLNWDPLLASIPPSDRIEWEFDLGLEAPYFPIEDELQFSSLKLALSRFAKEVFPQYAERTASALLYRGSADFASFFRWSSKQEENWLSWKEGRPEAKEEHLRRLFCADAFAYYLQMLAHALPDELPLTLRFDLRGCGSPAEARQLISRERFEHFRIAREELDAPLAVCMPPERQCSGSVLAQLDALFDELKEPFRVIEEMFLTESWEGVDRLYVLSDAVTAQGKRMLRGFCAAGGSVVVVGEPLGLPNEDVWK